MSHHITILAEQPIPRHDEITIEQYCTHRLQCRRRVTKRMLARVPLFAAEFMRAEFPEVTPEQVVTDATRTTRKHKPPRTKKDGLKRYGRYPMYSQAMERYQLPATRMRWPKPRSSATASPRTSSSTCAVRENSGPTDFRQRPPHAGPQNCGPQI